MFEFLEENYLLEWWDCDFEAWYYEPYRARIAAQFKVQQAAWQKQQQQREQKQRKGGQQTHNQQQREQQQQQKGGQLAQAQQVQQQQQQQGGQQGSASASTDSSSTSSSTHSLDLPARQSIVRSSGNAAAGVPAEAAGAAEAELSGSAAETNPQGIGQDGGRVRVVPLGETEPGGVAEIRDPDLEGDS